MLVWRWVSRFPLSLLSPKSALYTCVWNWSQHITYLLAATPCLKRDETWFEYNFWNFHFRTFDYVRSLNCSISERSIVFDWQKFWVSSIMFNYRTQLRSIERLEFDWVRLPNVLLTTPWFIHAYSANVEYDIKSKYPEEYSTIDKVGSKKLLARKSCFV